MLRAGQGLINYCSPQKPSWLSQELRQSVLSYLRESWQEPEGHRATEVTEPRLGEDVLSLIGPEHTHPSHTHTHTHWHIHTHAHAEG